MYMVCYGPGLLVELLNAFLALFIALTFNGYEIKGKWTRLVLAALLVGAASSVFFFFPQWLRIGCLVGAYYSAFRVVFSFSVQRAFLACLVAAFVLIIGNLTCSLFITYVFNISMHELTALPHLQLTFPFLYALPLAIVAGLAHKRRWRLLPNNNTDKAVKLTSPLFVQVIIMAAATCEILFLPLSETTRASAGTISFILLISTLLSFLFIWHTLQSAEREAQGLAHEKLATEIKSTITEIRTQRHDFTNHIQTMLALLQSGQKDELAKYVRLLSKELES